jgi:hypothetical protein
MLLDSGERESRDNSPSFYDNDQNKSKNDVKIQDAEGKEYDSEFRII